MDVRIAVLGAGTMGQGIAITLARGGRNVTMFDVDGQALARAESASETFFAESVRRGKLAEQQAREAHGRIGYARDLSAVAGSAVVVEALPERLDLKREVLARVEALCDAATDLHTNTSTLPIASIAAALARPERLVGTHYCNPAPLMPLVEVARGPQSGDDVVAAAIAMIEDVGKIPVVLNDSPGLITNFLVVAFENDSIRALESGLASAPEIDLVATRGMGFPIGPFRLLDIVGLDVHRAVADSLHEQLGDERYRVPETVHRMISEGRLGRKTGEGFYSYAREAS